MTKFLRHIITVFFIIFALFVWAQHINKNYFIQSDSIFNTLNRTDDYEKMLQLASRDATLAKKEYGDKDSLQRISVKCSKKRKF